MKINFYFRKLSCIFDILTNKINKYELSRTVTRD